MITERLATVVGAALAAARDSGALQLDELPPVTIERPRRREHGDWATNIALALAQGGNPRDVAETIVAHLPESDLIEKVEIAGPGFLNFTLSPAWLHDVIRQAADSSTAFGRSDPTGRKVNVEYVSGNPTGPVTVVLGRHAAVGDTLARLLESTGNEVVREYYFNDAGRQVVLFAASVAARYLELFGVEAPFPEDGYQGEYVKEMAEHIAEEVGRDLLQLPDEERVERIRQLGAPRMMAEIKASLERFGTTFDVWFSEAKLHAANEVMGAIEVLQKKGFIEERDAAVWFLSSRLGDDKDRVVIRANGQPTYFAADLGYLLDKFARGFDHLIYIWGADHHGTIPRFFAAVEALGFERERVEVPIIQIVKLLRAGETVKGSKRAGVVVPLDELVDEVGVDAARYTFLTRSTDAPLDFDIDAVKAQDPSNPVYYVQYQHARICSILRKAGEEGARASGEAALELLTHPSEDTLMRRLAAYEEMVVEAANQRAPQKVTRYVEELASDFSGFYRDCKVVTGDEALTDARLTLCVATRRVIADSLGLLGVSAPERM